jgi:hypothetical protein
MSATLATSPGVIEPGQYLTLKEAKARLGLSVAGLRKMRRAGLPVKYWGGRGFLKSDDLISFLDQHSTDAK